MNKETFHRNQDVQVILFAIDCTIFFTNLHKLFCQFVNWTNWVNFGKFMDNCWISCQVMVDIKKFMTISQLSTCNTLLSLIQLFMNKSLVAFAAIQIIVPTYISPYLFPNLSRRLSLLKFRYSEKVSKVSSIFHFLLTLISRLTL